MANTITGNLSATPYTFGIVVSRFNEFITRRLLDAALDCLRRHGVKDNAVDVVYCPGAFEIPIVAQELASSKKYHAVICFGCVIRGETPHFDHVASAATAGITKAALETNIPVIFGVLTTETLEQAIDRAGAKGGNKGWDAAMTAIEMADLQSMLSQRNAGE